MQALTLDEVRRELHKYIHSEDLINCHKIICATSNINRTLEELFQTCLYLNSSETSNVNLIWIRYFRDTREVLWLHMEQIRGNRNRLQERIQKLLQSDAYPNKLCLEIYILPKNINNRNKLEEIIENFKNENEYREKSYKRKQIQILEEVLKVPIFANIWEFLKGSLKEFANPIIFISILLFLYLIDYYIFLFKIGFPVSVLNKNPIELILKISLILLFTLIGFISLFYLRAFMVVFSVGVIIYGFIDFIRNLLKILRGYAENNNIGEIFRIFIENIGEIVKVFFKDISLIVISWICIRVIIYSSFWWICIIAIISLFNYEILGEISIKISKYILQFKDFLKANIILLVSSLILFLLAPVAFLIKETNFPFSLPLIHYFYSLANNTFMLTFFYQKKLLTFPILRKINNEEAIIWEIRNNLIFYYSLKSLIPEFKNSTYIALKRKKKVEDFCKNKIKKNPTLEDLSNLIFFIPAKDYNIYPLEGKQKELLQFIHVKDAKIENLNESEVEKIYNQLISFCNETNFKRNKEKTSSKNSPNKTSTKQGT